MKIKSVNTLHVAATQWLDTADLNDLFPEHLRNVVDNQPEFCGWQGVYVKDNFAVATARWQTKTIRWRGGSRDAAHGAERAVPAHLA